MKCSLGISNFHEISSSFPFYWFPLFLCLDRWRRLSYLSLLFFGTLHSNGYIFPLFLCLSLLFFSSSICKVSDNHFAFLSETTKPTGSHHRQARLLSLQFYLISFFYKRWFVAISMEYFIQKLPGCRIFIVLISSSLNSSRKVLD